MNINYGEKLKELREYNDMSQKDVANMMGIERSSYNQFEQQYDIIPIRRLNDLANIFNCSIDYILNLTENKKYKPSKLEIDNDKSRERLKDLRKEKKLTQAKLAEILGTTQSVIAGFELGRNLIATPFLYDLCKTYKVSADYLLGKIDEPKFF